MNPERDFYVSIVRSSRQRGLLAGPLATHEAALALVDEARRTACALDPWCDFDLFGTCSLPFDPANPAGKLNDRLGVAVRCPVPLPRTPCAK